MKGTSYHCYNDAGVCVWCGTRKELAYTKNCPMCPYDEGLAFLEEVNEP